ncbi:hypothetical protein B0I37DRAFT_195561 [Chaetomium sp. MPI-CAGE-AT-0009]|nr:hypothetical protein B0I37DRAFT_195561 [Chaetomium sp. MPI-CAGE-AT-0009]
MRQQPSRRVRDKVIDYSYTKRRKKAGAGPQPAQGGDQTRAKRQRREADAVLSPRAELAALPDVGVTPSPDGSPPPDAQPSPNTTAVTPLGGAPPPPPGGAEAPSTNSIVPSPSGAGAAAPFAVSGNEQDADKTAKGQICTILLQPYGGDMHAVEGRGTWEDLSVSIGALVRNHFVKVINWDTLDAGKKEKLATWAPRAKDYLTCDWESRSKLSRPRIPFHRSAPFPAAF